MDTIPLSRAEPESEETRLRLNHGKSQRSVSQLPSSHCDVEYHLNTHMLMSSKLLGPAIKAVSVEIGRNGVTPDEPPPFAAICSFTCETIEDFMAAFNPVAADLQGDIPKYTDITPIIKVSDIRIG